LTVEELKMFIKHGKKLIRQLKEKEFYEIWIITLIPDHPNSKTEGWFYFAHDLEREYLIWSY
jgi:hypothetical protein